VPSIALRPEGKKAVPVPESWHRSKLRLVLFSVYHDGSKGKRKDTLHGRAKLVERMGDRLAAPFLIAAVRAQIVDPYNDAIEWARVRWCVWILV
jgi:hypothetical protein